MTTEREKAIKMLKAKLECMTLDVNGCDDDCNRKLCDQCHLNYEKGNMGEQKEYLRMSIEALEQESILDKIRAEIIEEKDCAYADFERYKVEYLGQDWEDALDSLPQDDFRYGMERAVEIIDKYKVEKEDNT